MSINREVDKDNVEHIYNGILLSHLKEWNWVVVETWIDLEIVLQSEVNLREKQILCNVTYMWNLEEWYR